MTASTPSFSADVPSWAGAYIGATAGYGWGGSNSTILPVDDVFVAFFQQQGTMPGSLHHNFSGVLGGAEIGYNWQFGRWVTGLEADLSYARIKGNVTEYRPQVGASPEMLTSHSAALEWFGTARARLGFLATPDMLLFASGGLAYGYAKVSTGLVPEPTFPCSSNAICSTGSHSGAMAGWAFGGGLETKIASKWTAKIEYLHFNLGSIGDTARSHSANPFWNGLAITETTSDIKGDIVRVGLNYQL